MKGKQANGVGSQYSCTRPPNVVNPTLLTTIKTYDKLPSIMESCIAGWVPVELYIVVGRIVDHNN